MKNSHLSIVALKGNVKKKYKLSPETSQSGSVSGNAAITGLDIYQNNIRTDSADAVPGDHIVILSANHAKQLTRPGNNNGGYTPVRDLHLQIANKPQTMTVVDTNDFFTPQF